MRNGIIEKYRKFLPVSKKTPVISLNEGNTPLIFAGHISSLMGENVEVYLKDIVIQPRAIQKEILRDMLDRSGGLVKKLSFRHWKEMEALVRRKGKGSSVHLPGGVRVTRTDKALIFSRI